VAMSTRPFETRFSPLSQIVRRRILPVPGEVTVRVGDWVGAGDIVAKASIQGHLYPIDLAQSLQVSVDSISRHLEVSKGQAVAEGSTLATARQYRIGKRVVKAPFSGTVQGISEGVIFLRKECREFQLRAYVPGQVCEQFPHRGVAIRTVGCLIRGVWGSGGEGQGLLTTTVAGPGETLTWDKIGLHHRGMILIGGAVGDPRVLFRAKRFGLSGLILGSILPRLESICEGLPLPVVISEGMGRIPIAEPVSELLRAHDGSPAVISGSNRDRCSGPEIIVPLPADGKALPQPMAHPLEVGASVRLTRAPHLGAVGKVISLPTTPQETAIGTRLDGAKVRLDDGSRIFVPFPNLELLG